jgi:tRNA dimethylallyltransferase
MFACDMALIGCTGVGKSAVAQALARRVGAEIISVDSMQVYRGLDIGTAKPSLVQRAEIHHHLVDICSLDEPFSAADFVVRATEAASAIRGRHRGTLFCGGTGLYLKAFIEGLGEGPPGDQGLRRQLESRPVESLLEELKARDPITYQHIDPRNRRRVVRALEIILATGRPWVGHRAPWSTHSPERSSSSRVHVVVLERARGDLRQRIDGRVEAMFKRGLVAETARLIDQGLRTSPTARQAIGYRQVVEYLDGFRSLEDTVTLVKQRTWQYARRQATWNRHQFQAEWKEVGPDADPEAVAALLEADWMAVAEGAPGGCRKGVVIAG